MLCSLSIRDYILIDAVHLPFGEGAEFIAFTGETGAGKSIILEALNLTLGARSESGVVRQGASQAVIVGEYSVSRQHPVQMILQEHGVEPGDILVLRRVVTPDGRSRAYVNDQAVSVGLMRRMGQMLVALHGQFDTLWSPTAYQDHLDAFGGHQSLRMQVQAAYTTWRHHQTALEELRHNQTISTTHGEFLRHSLAELTAADPKLDEEATLLEQRQLIQQKDKIIKAVDTALTVLEGEGGMPTALRALEKINMPELPGAQSALQHLTIAASEIADAVAHLHDVVASVGRSDMSAEAIDDRLHLLRGLARKHRCLVVELPDIHTKLAQQIDVLENYDSVEAELSAKADVARQEFYALAQQLHQARVQTAERIVTAVSAELPALHLPQVRFHVTCTELPEAQWHAAGIDAVTFSVATNQDTLMGPIHEIASGGERSRLMLALQAGLVLHGAAHTQGVETLVFDEIDNGTGGAAAAAIGAKLRALGQVMQVISITHSPQVAASAHQHYVISKTTTQGRTQVTAALLDMSAREAELARMLAGATVTPESQQAAKKLLAGG